MSYLDAIRRNVAFLFLCFFAATAGAQAPAAPTMGYQGETEPVLVEWRVGGEPLDGTRRELKEGALQIAVVSRAEETVEASIALLADDGSTGRTYSDLGSVTLRPGTTKSVDLTLDGLRGLDLSDMRFSGQLLASATVHESGREGSTTQRVWTPELYFHRDAAGGTLVYGEAELRESFGAGDLRGSIQLPTEATGGGVFPAQIAGVPARIRGAAPGTDDTDTDTGGGGIPWVVETEGIPGADDPSPGPAADLPIHSGEHRLCIRWEIDVADKGNIQLDQDGDPFSEDYWHGLNDPGSTEGIPGPPSTNLVVTARGVWIVVQQGDWAKAIHADPATGCANFRPPGSDPVNVFVATVHEDARSNFLRVVQEGIIDLPFFFVEVGVELPELGKTAYVYVGDFTSRATLAAVTGFAAYRENFGLSNREMKFVETTCGADPDPGANTSSAHNPGDQNSLPSGRARLTVHRGGTSPCDTSDHRRRKFLITHEMGHAWMLLARGEAEYEDAIDWTLVDAAETMCPVPSTSYFINSLEWSSVPGREGMAHFYGARVFNRTDQDEALFTWFGTPFSFEPPQDEGGLLWNVCDTPDKCGRGTILDWARFWWNWHAPHEPGSSPTTRDLQRVYTRTQDNGLLSRSNYYERSRKAMFDVIDVPTWHEAWIDASLANGTGEGCSTLYDYPDCDCWVNRDDPLPASCRGVEGCPCGDISVSNPLDLLTKPDLAPDGSGSLLDNGFNGPGQQCNDTGDARLVCNAEEVVGGTVPVCRSCEDEPYVGCECTTDGDCGDGTGLSCYGTPENGWKGSQPGVCLPTKKAELTGLFWFCLDNCGAKGNGFACVFDQLKNHPLEVVLDHGQYVNLLSDGPSGFCESRQDGYRMAPPDLDCPVDDNTDPDVLLDNCCEPECENTAECHELWGFPDHFVCTTVNADLPQPGHCVPQDCANAKNPLPYCSLYR